jgi:hypothetical protein
MAKYGKPPHGTDGAGSPHDRDYPAHQDHVYDSQPRPPYSGDPDPSERDSGRTD